MNAERKDTLNISTDLKWNVSIGAGPSFQAFKQYIGYQSAIDPTITYDSSAFYNATYGDRWQGRMRVEYFANEWISFEIGFMLIDGNKHLTNRFVNPFISADLTNLISIRSMSIPMGLSMKFLTRNKIAVSLHGDLQLGFGSKAFVETYETVGSKVTRSTLSGGIYFGAESGLEVSYKLTDHFQLNIMTAIGIAQWTPKKGDVTSFTVSGVDQMSTLTPSETHWNYDENVYGQPAYSSIIRLPRQAFPLHFFSPSFGLVYSF